jgi:cell division septation protein DedD
LEGQLSVRSQNSVFLKLRAVVAFALSFALVACHNLPMAVQANKAPQAATQGQAGLLKGYDATTGTPKIVRRFSNRVLSIPRSGSKQPGVNAKKYHVETAYFGYYGGCDANGNILQPAPNDPGAPWGGNPYTYCCGVDTWYYVQSIWDDGLGNKIPITQTYIHQVGFYPPSVDDYLYSPTYLAACVPIPTPTPLSTPTLPPTPSPSPTDTPTPPPPTPTPTPTPAPIQLSANQAFSPNGDGFFDSNNIQITTSTDWTLSVSGAGGQGTIRTGSANPLPFDWDGKINGSALLDGSYNLTLTSGGQSVTVPTIIDTTAPTISNITVNPDSSASNAYTLTAQVKDNGPTGDGHMTDFDSTDPTALIVNITGAQTFQPYTFDAGSNTVTEKFTVDPASLKSSSLEIAVQAHDTLMNQIKKPYYPAFLFAEPLFAPTKNSTHQTNAITVSERNAWSLSVDGQGVIQTGTGATTLAWDGKLNGTVLKDGQYTLHLSPVNACVEPSPVPTPAPTSTPVTPSPQPSNGGLGTYRVTSLKGKYNVLDCTPSFQDQTAQVGIDTTPPVISNPDFLSAKLPSNQAPAGELSYNVAIAAKVQDADMAGLDTSSIKLSIPGVSVSGEKQQYDSSTNILTYSATITAARSKQTVTVDIVASDKAGNFAEDKALYSLLNNIRVKGGGGGAAIILDIGALALEDAVELGLKQALVDRLGPAAFVAAVRAGYALQSILSDAVPTSSSRQVTILEKSETNGFSTAVDDINSLAANVNLPTEIRNEPYKGQPATQVILRIPGEADIIARSLSSSKVKGSFGPPTLEIQLKGNPLIRDILNVFHIPQTDDIKIRYH